ncbi:hypothetical protein [Microbacterium oleivorans]|uniref:Uncharacterized protein n=1 Tax=Microbacterium oleivorans TaxID=273677 RepID=A0A4R5YPH5_9MICO|nr:hypothetical protein [Microbacterium oleivorans]TDL45247.1 hypothetical protein E2R54_01925 [Microbacterium oleivorans]
MLQTWSLLSEPLIRRKVKYRVPLANVQGDLFVRHFEPLVIALTVSTRPERSLELFHRKELRTFVNEGEGDATAASAAFLIGLIAQHATLVLLWRMLPPLDGVIGSRTPAWITGWYYLGAVFGAAVAGRFHAIRNPPIVTIGMAVGAFTLAATADYCLSTWHRRPSIRPDVAVFLGTSHVLALLVIIVLFATTVVVEMDDLSNDIVRNGLFALTFLSLPLCAGMWARIRATRELAQSAEVPLPQPGRQPFALAAGLVIVWILLMARRRDRQR